MSYRAVRVFAILAIAIVLSLASRAHAGWSADPVQVLGTVEHGPARACMACRARWIDAADRLC